MGEKSFVDAVKAKKSEIIELVEREVPDVSEEVKKELVKKLVEEEKNKCCDGGVGGNPRTFTGKDKYVADIANRIEAKYPGSVKHVETLEPSVINGLDRELDIVLNDGTIIQVKKDNARGLNGQLTATGQHFPGRRVIGVHPDQHSKNVIREITKSGNVSTDSIDNLVDNILSDLGEIFK